MSQGWLPLQSVDDREHRKEEVVMSSPLTVVELDEFCSNCGEWVYYLNFNYESGWCTECTQDSVTHPTCVRCGCALAHRHRSTCHTCRQELWLERHADELEFLMIVKGYSLVRAREVIAKMVRPICQCCGKPIVGAREGALFCKRNKQCHAMYLKFVRLRKSGLTASVALATIKL